MIHAEKVWSGSSETLIYIVSKVENSQRNTDAVQKYDIPYTISDSKFTMLSWHWYLLIPFFFVISVLAQGSPSGNDPGDLYITLPNFKNGTVRPNVVLTGFEGCEIIEDPCDPKKEKKIDQKAAIKKGFEDMNVMIPAPEDPADGNERYPIDWEDASAIEYFGSYQRNEHVRDNIQCKFFLIAPNVGTSVLKQWNIDNMNQLVR